MTAIEKTTPLTDAEIKQALECCVNEDCKNCRIYTSDEQCVHILHKSTLDLINRKDAEIERLKNLLEGWKTEAYKVACEKDKLYCEAVERVKTTKAAAIKEFAERLKPMYKALCVDEGDWYNELDNLVKEMVGDAE